MARDRISHAAVALVTGAGSGIGAAFATELGRRGGQVVCTDIDEAAAAVTAESIRAAGGQAMAMACDVGKLRQLEAAAREGERWAGKPVEVVINNAGVGAGGAPVGEIPMADWRWLMDINLWGVVHGCHVFAPRLRELGRGGIINVCSTASFAAAPLMGPYNVSKAAVLALSETLAAELSGSGVHVTALCPTFVKTNIARDARTPDDSRELAAKLMARTGVSADRVARQTLDALDRNQLYVLPQADARAIWRAKRLWPALYARGAGLLGRLSARQRGQAATE
ncbi:MAG: SDR family NAD(P)-dependent oxidoreductase [Alcanivoracaceae bacterium]